jgi:epoxyqueuosine reductase
MSITRQVENRAIELGFDLVGIAPAVTPRGVTHLREWLERGFAGEMGYMQRHASAREHPRHLLDGVHSLVIVAMNYRTHAPVAPGPLEGRVSRYAWGEDYHRIMRSTLKQLGDYLHQEVPGCHTRAVVDTAPLLERDFAQLAGIGWIGKNTMLINKRLGSWLFLGSLLTDVELESSQPHAADHCGTCTRCLDACPTDAFVAPHQLDSRRCISYLNIELRGQIPEELRPGIGNWLFGCDICQEVCPWNSKAPVSNVSEYEARQAGGNLDLTQLLEMSDESLANLIAGSTMTRTGLTGLRRNATIVLGNAGDPAALPVLERLTEHENDTVRDAATWAIDRIESRIPRG